MVTSGASLPAGMGSKGLRRAQTNVGGTTKYVFHALVPLLGDGSIVFCLLFKTTSVLQTVEGFRPQGEVLFNRLKSTQKIAGTSLVPDLQFSLGSRAWRRNKMMF